MTTTTNNKNKNNNNNINKNNNNNHSNNNNKSNPKIVASQSEKPQLPFQESCSNMSGFNLCSTLQVGTSSALCH